MNTLIFIELYCRIYNLSQMRQYCYKNYTYLYKILIS